MNTERLLSTLDTLAAFTASPGCGVTRFSWSAEDAAARAWLMAHLTELGLSPACDGFGNVRARMRGTGSGPAVYIGSHLDSVRNGGRLDGAFGVAAALETLRGFRESGITPGCDIEFIAFAEEEGSNFGCTCLGSKYLAGLLDEDTIASLRGADGRTAEETLRAAGMNPGRMKADRLALGCGRIFLECHIEQNAVLEREGLSIGIVTAITGMRLHRVTLHGVSDHAASPMEGRRDPAAGFAECAYAMERMWTDGILPRGFSCTVGHAEFTPGVGIVIPGAVEFTVDLRHVDTAELEKGWAAILETFGRIADRRGLTLETERLSASGGALMSQEAQDTLAAIAAAEGAAFRRMVSGPAHDAAAMASVMPAGMVFVPSCGGLSHCPAERTEPADLALGARIFESAVRHFAEGRPAMEEAQPPR